MDFSKHLSQAKLRHAPLTTHSVVIGQPLASGETPMLLLVDNFPVILAIGTVKPGISVNQLTREALSQANTTWSAVWPDMNWVVFSVASSNKSRLRWLLSRQLSRLSSRAPTVLVAKNRIQYTNIAAMLNLPILFG